MIGTMTRALKIRRATTADMHAIIGLVDEASGWLRLKGTDQWAQPWPSREARDERMRRDLRGGKTWIAEERDGIVGTVSCRRSASPKLWHETERAEPALYLSRLIVTRRTAGQGIGANLIEWAGHRATQEWRARWIRIDVWTTNRDLHKYYEKQGFSFCRLCRYTDYPSGALFQKSTSGLASQEVFYPENTDMALVPNWTRLLRVPRLTKRAAA